MSSPDPALDAPRLVFGSMARRDQSESTRIEILHAAVEAGLTAIDTAPLYGFGSAERYIGKAFSAQDAQGIQIFTKVGLRWDDDARGDVLFHFDDPQGQRRAVRKDSRPESVVWEVEQSLARLGRSCVDLVQIHQPDIHTPIDETMSALSDLKRAGKLRHIGVSNFSPQQVEAAQHALGSQRLASVQQGYSLLERDAEQQLIGTCVVAEVALLAFSPLAGGRLALPPTAASSRFEKRLIAACLAPLADQHEVDQSAIALAWVIAQHGVTAAVVGASSTAQLEQLAKAQQVNLSDEELRLLSAYSKPPYLAKVNQLSRRIRGKFKRLMGRIVG